MRSGPDCPGEARRATRGTMADGSNDALETLLDDGAEIVVGFYDEERRDMFRRSMWIVRFRIEEGEHVGRLISWWLRALDPQRRVARGSAIATSYVAATGLRPPRDLARRRPSHWLSGAQYLVRTRVVGRDVHGIARPPEASYSVVSAILKRVAGIPPALASGNHDGQADSRPAHGLGQRGAGGRVSPAPPRRASAGA